MAVDSLTQENTILVVDDTPTNLQVLFDLLSEQGYRVAIAKNGEIALQRIAALKPSLILLDVMMPGIDGFETCQRLKADPNTCDIPVIFMTALSDSVDKVKGLRLGAVDYITKPIQHEEVLARIQVHLQLCNATRALERRTADLEAALENLKNTQLQLVQSEKMSALGQLVAGIAHEINNPINFIHGNLTHAKEYIQELLTFVELCQQQPPVPITEVQQYSQDIDLEFLCTDLFKLLDSMAIGTDRILDLVVSLRNFSRLDESPCKTVNLHDGIDSTIVILQYRLKAQTNCPAIQIIRDYGDLPEIECYPSQLNQVFMNLLSNAIDAFESSTSQEPTITIRTSLITRDASDSIPPSWVVISIADNASGIPESIQSKLFDPFFTTKAVGKGTGLGLSISHQIITEKHQGKIECHSTLGQGTEFVVQIPVTQV
ncbi:response regulator [Alkalinema sp. FACHB-956]|uniref:sensor histidine kinase n=1 Tax=Alkalinema sp. FACHB-956 TaxID=2692768 RepID=UPI0016842B05|nr:response regulator [Alkalinema sp. FACHB-956]MBD2327961.1 hybrid sensor histidine kinase/response regulator [Alkalinema sp. FACHB-956]